MTLLYKYRSCSNLDEFERIKSILGGELWFSIANKVNDPFEFRCAVDFGFSRAETIEAFAKVENHVNPATSRLEAFEKSKRVFGAISDERLRLRQAELSLNIWRQLASNTAMCCLSGTPTSTLLWSHYAAGHTGVAIEMEMGSLTSSFHKVRYSDDLTPISPLSLVNPIVAWRNELFDNIFLRKSECWSYEEEYRILKQTNASFAGKMNPGFVTRLILGCAMNDATKQQWFAWIKEKAPSITVANAVPSGERSYALAIQNM